ncbi:MAG: hypothetical protein KQH67_03915 [Bacteroidetes bacterium]|nr:hypothetical protein [Bacteroidota bacterium]
MKYLQTTLMFILIAFSSTMLASELNNSRSITLSDSQFVDCGSVVTTVGENIAELSGSSVQYQIRIENTGNTTSTFTIYAEDFSASGENPDGSSMENNLDFNQELLDINLNPINEEITLAPGETYDFIVKLSLPFGNEYDRWNCTEVKAINSSCPENEGRTVVFTYVPVPDGVIIGYNDYNVPLNKVANQFSDVSLFV